MQETAACERNRPPHGCNGCNERWWGAGIAHCAAPGCHRTFASVKYFDQHRDQRGERGRCIDPATIEGVEFRDGMWRGPEMSDEAKAKMRERAGTRSHADGELALDFGGAA